jgi:hypothetical protein
MLNNKKKLRRKIIEKWLETLPYKHNIKWQSIWKKNRDKKSKFLRCWIHHKAIVINAWKAQMWKDDRCRGELQMCNLKH